MNSPHTFPGLDEEHAGRPLDEKTVDDLASRLVHSPIKSDALDGAHPRLLQQDLLRRDPHLQRVLQQILDRAWD